MSEPSQAQLDGIVTFMKGVLYDLTPEERAAFDAAKQELEAVVAKHGDAGVLAFSFIGAELAAQSTKW